MSHDLTAEEVARLRAEWRREPLDEETLACYRINYEPVAWTRWAHEQHFPAGAALAIERLICEVERLRGVIAGATPVTPPAPRHA